MGGWQQVMQCNGEAVLVVIHSNNTSTAADTTEAQPALLWEITSVSVSQARLHSNLPWPMALAAPTKDGQAQSRGVAVEGLGFARRLALALARSLLLACTLCFGGA
jgi:hypothetical protein